ncbi:tetratricopeptide repeat protein [Actinoplanes aureus]|uniref:Tetratricopeptide repeat protein n=1 Tax=Actinoplanes aureus TaxID=2792083 RepID=A0A931G280_9ACTN|nr:tetratricopeptide repeat protein [Actinoplanes aureus]MBG0565891.1 tetratricopeptide repeat protein [Actinoplanes aureus]
MQPSRPDHVTALAALWPYLRPERVGATQPVARLLPAARGRCGVYVLTFADGRLQVGQAANVVSRFATHRKSCDDLVEMHFWRFARAGLDSAEQAALHALQDAGFALRTDAGFSAAELRAWLASPPADTPGCDARPVRPQLRASGRDRFARLAADPRFDPLIPALRRYLARTMPFPRRTELSGWSASACPQTGAGLLTVTVHGMETLSAGAAADDPDRTIIQVNLDAATVQRYQGAVDRFGAAHCRTAGPGVLTVSVDGARNLMRLLDVPGVVDAARRLNLDLMRKGPAVRWRSHSFDLADLLLEPAAEIGGDPFAAGLACDERGDIPRAEHLYRRAALAGDPHAAFRLGELWSERGDADQAEPWYRMAGAGGFHGVRRHPAAGSVYALIEKGRDAQEQGELGRAAQWYRRAAVAGSTASYLDLGDVLALRGQFGTAADAYRSAAGSGHPHGWYRLGVLRHEHGDLDEAEAGYRRAIDAGHPAGWAGLGLLRHQRGDLAEAEACLRTAVAERHTESHLHLGDLLHERGDHDAAEQQYRLAAAAGHTAAVTRLGRLYLHLDELDAAEPLLRAVAADDPEAMYLLSQLLDRRRQCAEADGWLHRAADAGHERAAALVAAG